MKSFTLIPHVELIYHLISILNIIFYLVLDDFNHISNMILPNAIAIFVGQKISNTDYLKRITI